jgi:hypothetical protein
MVAFHKLKKKNLLYLIYGVDNNETIEQFVEKYVTLNNSYICKIHKCININELVGRIKQAI